MSTDREERYIVLKLSDVERAPLLHIQRIELKDICRCVSEYRKASGKAPLDCIVIESEVESGVEGLAPDEALIKYVGEYLTNLCRENWLSPREISEFAIHEYIRRSAGKEKT